MDIAKELGKSRNMVLVMGKEYYKSLLKLNRELSEANAGICYVTFAKPAHSLLEEFGKNGIKTGNFHFIDCIGRQANTCKDGEGCSCISAPDEMREIGGVIMDVLDSGKYSLLIFDSISSMLLYNDPLKTVRFLNNLMIVLEEKRTKGLFRIMKNDVDKPPITEIVLFADRVEKYE